MLRLNECGKVLVTLADEVGKVLFNIDEVIKMAVLTIFATPDGRYSHMLLEAPPGMGKTILCKTLADWCNLRFTRIQLTPDMQPGEIVMSHELEMKDGGVRTKMVFGPVFTNILLADEINRTPPRTQASILQPMAEIETTYGGRSYPLGYDMSAYAGLSGEAFNEKLKKFYEEGGAEAERVPDCALFYVFATQNPIENEGTYRLPEAQLDRFLFKLDLDYPTDETLKEIIRRKGVIGQYCRTYYLENIGKSRAVDAIESARDYNANNFSALVAQFAHEVEPTLKTLFDFDVADEGNRSIVEDEVVKLVYSRNRGFKKQDATLDITPEKIIAIRNAITLQVGVSDHLYYDYISHILGRILESAEFEMKVSPRFCDTIISVAKAHCLFRNWKKHKRAPQEFDPDRLFITKEDINSCAIHMLPHRVSLSYEAQAKGQTTKDVVTSILKNAYNNLKFRSIE